MEEKTVKSKGVPQWSEHKDMVLYRLEEISKQIRHISDSQDLLLKQQYLHDKRISIVELKSGIFGTLGGALAVIFSIGLEWMRSHLK